MPTINTDNFNTDDENIEVIVDDIIAKMIEEGERAEEEFVDEELNARDHIDNLGSIIAALTDLASFYAILVDDLQKTDQ